MSILSDEIISKIETAEQQNKDNPEAIYSLYIHIVPKEISGYDWDKYYVGITKNVKRRWRCNGIEYKPKKEYSSPFWNAIKKYEWKNIIHIIITNTLLFSQAEEYEIKIIKYLKSDYHDKGYNRTIGGQGGNRSRGCNIAQYDLNGNFLHIYNNLEEACKDIPKCESCNIVHSMKKKNSQSGGYMWRKVVNGHYDMHIEPYVKKHSRLTPVAQFDDKLLCLGVYQSIKEASEKLRINASNITLSCTTKYKASNFKWKYLKDVDESEITDSFLLQKYRELIKKGGV